MNEKLLIYHLLRLHEVLVLREMDEGITALCSWVPIPRNRGRSPAPGPGAAARGPPPSQHGPGGMSPGGRDTPATGTALPGLSYRPLPRSPARAACQQRGASRRWSPTVVTALSQYGQTGRNVPIFPSKIPQNVSVLLQWRKTFVSIPIPPAKWLVWMLKLKKLFFSANQKKTDILTTDVDSYLVSLFKASYDLVYSVPTNILDPLAFR